MKFCSHCGHGVTLLVPPGDNRPRHVCAQCGAVHYSNPKNVCGAILTWQNQVLLCRRAIEPRYGLWTLPAGFMENGETVIEAAARESMEEANASASRLSLFGVFSLPHISQVYLMFQGELENPDFYPGEESLQTQLFDAERIPWDELAFSVIDYSLKLFFQGDRSISPAVHTATAIRHGDGRVDWVQR